MAWSDKMMVLGHWRANIYLAISESRACKALWTKTYKKKRDVEFKCFFFSFLFLDKSQLIQSRFVPRLNSPSQHPMKDSYDALVTQITAHHKVTSKLTTMLGLMHCQSNRDSSAGRLSWLMLQLATRSDLQNCSFEIVIKQLGAIKKQTLLNESQKTIWAGEQEDRRGSERSKWTLSKRRQTKSQR